jgi:hypothetical protein
MVFERIENFLHRPSPSRLRCSATDTRNDGHGGQSHVEVLLRVRQRRLGRIGPVSKFYTKHPSLTESHSEKYLKRLAGRTDLEDALKKLDKFTQEEARMGIAHNLRTIQNVDGRMNDVNDSVAELMGCTLIVLCWSPKSILIPRWKGGKGGHSPRSR